MPWIPYSVVAGDLGYWMVVINGVDVTYWRGVPIQLKNYTVGEPFGDSVAQIDIPQITPLEPWPNWLANWASVDIHIVMSPPLQVYTLPPEPGGSLTVGTPYYWVVTALHSDQGETAASLEVTQTPTSGNQTVEIRWAPAYRATGYNIYRSTTSGSYGPSSLVATVQGETTGSYIDTGTATIAGSPPLTGTALATVWEGMVSSIETHVEETTYLVSLHCIGALHQLDNYVRAPAFKLTVEDIGIAICKQFDHDSRPALRTGICNAPVTGIGTSRKGFWNPVLTGYIQDLLSYATTDLIPATGELIINIEKTQEGNGYWILGDKGSVFAFGPTTHFYGAIRDVELVGKGSDINRTYTGKGYWVLGQDGGVFAFGDAPYLGSLPGLGSGVFNYIPDEHFAVSIRSHPTAYGYTICSNTGEIYCFGAAQYFGGNPPLVSGAMIMEMDVTDTGNGYAMVDNFGHVYCFGDARYFGGGNGTYYFHSMSMRPQNDGYYLAANLIDQNTPPQPQNDVYGYVFGYGLASQYAWGVNPPQQNWVSTDITVTPSGNGFWVVGADGGVFTGGDAQYYGSIPGEDTSHTSMNKYWGPNQYQWTVQKIPGRQPIILIKDWITQDWHITTGTPGMDIQLSWDLTMSPNAIYGEGVDINGCHWRNSKFPTPGLSSSSSFTPPPFPGYILKFQNSLWTGVSPSAIANPDPNVVTWQQWLHDHGWPNIAISGMFDGYTFYATQQFQLQAGINATGFVDSTTWDTAWKQGITIISQHPNVGPIAGSDIAYFAALSEDPRTDPYIYNAAGAVIAYNPLFDPNIIRVERFANLGEKIAKDIGIISALNWRLRDSVGSALDWRPPTQDVNAQNPGWVGRIVLKTDPEEGSRFFMKAGQNLMIHQWHGQELLVHINEAEAAPQDMTMTLTVDSRARDLMTAGAVWARDRDTNDLGRRQRMHHRMSRMVIDNKSMWDCEAGSGIIPINPISASTPGTVGAQNWIVVRIPAGERGDIAHVQAKTTQADGTTLVGAQFAMAVFDQLTMPNWIANVQPLDTNGNPTGAAGDPTNGNFWDFFPENSGLIIGWGGNQAMCGFYPYTQADGFPATGQFSDGATWYYQSTAPPWIWVAFWCNTNCYISGAIYPSTTDVTGGG